MKHNNRKKTLRQIYNADPAAKKFLEDHPEFNDRFLEQTEVHTPGFNITEGRYTLHDISADRKLYGEIMLEAMQSLSEGSRYRRLLEDFYAGMPSKQIQKKFNLKTDGAFWSLLCRAKKASLKGMVKRQQVKIKGATLIATRTFTWQGKVRLVYLVMDEISRDSVWIKENGEVLPDYAQEILDCDKDFKEWDECYL